LIFGLPEDNIKRIFSIFQVLIASSQGGVNIEEVAAENPEAIVYEPIDINVGLTKAQADKITKAVGLDEHVESTSKMLLNLYDLFVKKDALLLEINPYAEDAGETRKWILLLFYSPNSSNVQNSLIG
jgi:succinyl-CoA synthetase beta subunit